jgi:hypothetical protein
LNAVIAAETGMGIDGTIPGIMSQNAERLADGDSATRPLRADLLIGRRVIRAFG